MDFNYEITFYPQQGPEVVRTGRGLFYPHDGGFNLEHMLWLMTEEYGRPSKIEVKMFFADDSLLEGVRRLITKL